MAGALAVIRYAKIHGIAMQMITTIGRAWAMMAKGERYKQPVALAA